MASKRKESRPKKRSPSRSRSSRAQHYTEQDAYKLHERFYGLYNASNKGEGFHAYLVERLSIPPPPLKGSTPDVRVANILHDPWTEFHAGTGPEIPGCLTRKAKNTRYINFAFNVPFEELPLHINHTDKFLKEIISWRLDIGR